MAIFECELGNAGFVEVREAFGDHAIVLFLRCAGERQIETEISREFERDPAVFRGVCRGEETRMVAVLHVSAVRLQHARRGASLRKNFA